jgi:hypothetical protein
VYQLKSACESRFAKLLEMLVMQGSVMRWWYEPHQFSCGRQYRKDRLYTPDFLIHVNPVHDIFSTGTRCVWAELKTELDQDGKNRFHWLYKQYPHMKDKMLLMVDRNPNGRRSKSARRQRELQGKALKYIRRVLYATEWYPKFGIS